MLAWCGDEGFDMTIIEVMPMGDIGTENRLDQYLPLSKVRADLSKRFTLTDIPFRTGGPARYVKVEETGQKLGFITPLTQISVRAATVFASPALASCICVLDRTTILTCVAPCGTVVNPALMQPLLRPSDVSQRS